MRSSAADDERDLDSERDVATDGGVDRPEWVLPAVRSGLEVALLLLIAAYVWANVDSQLVQGVVAVVGIVGSVGVLFYYVNQQALAWVRYASAQNRQKRRKRKRKRRQRERQRRQQSSEE